MVTFFWSSVVRLVELASSPVWDAALSFAACSGFCRCPEGRAVGSAVRTDNKETGAIYLAIAPQREPAFGNHAEARKVVGGSEIVSRESRCGSRSGDCSGDGRRYWASRVSGTTLEEPLPSEHANTVAFAASHSRGSGDGQKESDPRPYYTPQQHQSSWGVWSSHTIFPTFIHHMYVEKHTWQPKTALPWSSSRKLSARKK